MQREAEPADDRREHREQVAEPRRPVELEPLLAPAQVVGLEQPRQAEHVIGVVVAEEHDVEIDEPDLRAQQLALRALAAIEQDAIAAAPDQRRGGRAAGRRRRARGAQEDDVQVHRAECTSAGVSARGVGSAGDAQDGAAVRDLATAGERVQPRAAQRAGRGGQRHESHDRQRAADEAGDVAVVGCPRSPRSRLTRSSETSRPGQGALPPSPPPGRTSQRAHGSTSRWPGTISALSSVAGVGDRLDVGLRVAPVLGAAIAHSVSPGRTTCSRVGCVPEDEPGQDEQRECEDADDHGRARRRGGG